MTNMNAISNNEIQEALQESFAQVLKEAYAQDTQVIAIQALEEAHDIGAQMIKNESLLESKVLQDALTQISLKETNAQDIPVKNSQKSSLLPLAAKVMAATLTVGTIGYVIYRVTRNIPFKY